MHYSEPISTSTRPSGSSEQCPELAGVMGSTIVGDSASTPDNGDMPNIMSEYIHKIANPMI